jgi:hypothetical protein
MPARRDAEAAHKELGHISVVSPTLSYHMIYDQVWRFLVVATLYSATQPIGNQWHSTGSLFCASCFLERQSDWRTGTRSSSVLSLSGLVDVLDFIEALDLKSFPRIMLCRDLEMSCSDF